MANPFTRLNLTDYYLSTMLPALEHVFMEELAARPDRYVNFFNVEDTTQSIVQASEIAGFGLFGQVNEGENVRYDSPIQAFNKTYTPVDFGLAFRTTHRMVADDKFSIVKRMAQALPKAAKETWETDFANHYNRAFNSSYTGPDGVVLCSTAHPLVGGGTQANRPSVDVDLDIPALEAAVTAFRNLTDHRGKKVRMVPKTLMVPPALNFTAIEITKSPMRSDTANNAVNAFANGGVEGGGMLQPEVYEYLTDADAWFLLAPTSELRIRAIWRERFATMHDIDFDSRSVKTAGWYTCTSGWDDYLGIYGTQGA